MANEVRIVITADDRTDRTFNAVERKVRTSFMTRMRASMGKVGGNSGAAFTAGFLKTITFGQVGSGFAQSAIRSAPSFAKAGGALGAAMAAGVILKLTTALTAALPLALGGLLLAGPIAFLIKNQATQLKDAEKAAKKADTLRRQIERLQDTDPKSKSAKANKAENLQRLKTELELQERISKNLRDRGNSLARLKERARDFMATISIPVRVPLAKSLDVLGDGMTKLEKPLVKIMKQIAPALVPLTKGIVGGIEAFIKAIAPEMPSVAAGMKAWGEAAPKIGKGMGEFIAKLIKDPKATVQAVQDLADSLVDLADSAADIVSSLQDAAAAYEEFAKTVDRFETSTGKEEGGPLGGIANQLDRGNVKIEEKIKDLRRIIVEQFKDMWSDARASFKENHAQIIDDVKNLKGRFVDSVQQMWDGVKQLFLRSRAETISDIKDWVDGVIDRIQELPGRAKAALSSLAGKITNQIEDAQDAVERTAKRMVNRFIDRIKELPGKAKAALSSLPDKITDQIEKTQDAVQRKVRQIVNRFIDRLRTLPGKASAALDTLPFRVGDEVEKTKDRVLNKVRDMVNRFIDRMQQLVRQARDQAGRVRGAITSQFAGAGGWLVSKGKAVIDGLLDGLKSKFNVVKRWVSGIAKWIKDHKGPISLDRQLLKPAGAALMGGLLSGLKFGFKGVGDFVWTAGSKVSDIISKIKAKFLSTRIGKFLGSIFGGQMPVPGAGRRHSGYPWADWAGDFPNPTGTPVRAWKSGIVGAVNHWGHSYGTHIRLLHAGARTLYAHLSKEFVRRGQFVKAGQIIGLVGSTGNSTGPHLHFEKYAQGGWIREPVVGMGQRSGKGYMFGEAGPELVIPRNRAGATVVNNYYLSAPNYVGSKQELVSTFVELKRQGRLDVIQR